MVDMVDMDMVLVDMDMDTVKEKGKETTIMDQAKNERNHFSSPK